MLTPREACEAICAAVGAEAVQTIGTKFVIYRPLPKEKKAGTAPAQAKKQKPGAAEKRTAKSGSELQKTAKPVRGQRKPTQPGDDRKRTKNPGYGQMKATAPGQTQLKRKPALRTGRQPSNPLDGRVRSQGRSGEASRRAAGRNAVKPSAKSFGGRRS